MPTSLRLTVQDLRERWLPHKQRLDSVRDSHPTSVRFHRACSWLDPAERLGPGDDLDQMLILQWTALNALYGQWNLDTHEPVPDRESWQVFLDRILELDASAHVVSLLKENRGLVLKILGNGYLNRHFWHEPSGEYACKTGRGGRHKGKSWYAEECWGTILEQVVERIYLLRCQLVHGAATLRSRLNRTALRDCTTMMRLLMPTILLVWIERGADEDWGLLCYPPIDSKLASRLR
jgi:hypothetical protein